MMTIGQPISGADGVKIAVLREGRANLSLIRAAAHLKRYMPIKESFMRIAGVDLAWNSAKNPSGVCIGKISDDTVKLLRYIPRCMALRKY